MLALCGQIPKQLSFLNVVQCSIVQKLLNVEEFQMRHFLHFSYVRSGAIGIFQYSIIFEQLNQISKTQLF